MVLNIKNMVCDRCIAVVSQQLHHLGFDIEEIALGTATVHPDPLPEQLAEIASSFKVLGFELIDKNKDKLVERIKNIIIEQIHHSRLPELHVNFSQLLSDQLHKDYGYLSRLFSDSEELTIEKFIIQQKVERVKELLQYDELNLNEIAFQMGYSSSAHLSNQFKSITGISPRAFKALGGSERRSIDKI